MARFGPSRSEPEPDYCMISTLLSHFSPFAVPGQAPPSWCSVEPWSDGAMGGGGVGLLTPGGAR